MRSERFAEVRYTRRWFCYLDLLGFENLVHTGGIENILPLYEEVLSHLEQAAGQKIYQGISFSWFSDTFIIFSKTGRPEQFALIEQACRIFFQKLILNQIPVRGALAFGDLYTQQERNIFIGPALVDAYKYGEGQEWLGFLLAPSTLVALEKMGLPPSQRLHYRVVRNSSVLKNGAIGPVYAYAFNSCNVNGKNPFVKPLESMKRAAGISQANKYENTLAFLHSA